MDRKVDFSVVLPVFNEERNIPLLVERYAGLCKRHDFEVIFVEDGGSSDGTRKAVMDAQAAHSFVRGVFPTVRGYGASIFAGLREAKGEYVCWTHADLQTDPADVITAFELRSSVGRQVYVKGNRKGRQLFDVFFTMGMSLFETVLLRTRLYDINAQPNLVHRDFLEGMSNPPQDFSWDLFCYYVAKKQGYRMVRFPVRFPPRQHGESSWNRSFGDKWRFIKRTMKFSLQMRKGVR